MKFRVLLTTTRLNPHVEKKEIVDITVKDTVVANVIYTKTINYTDSVAETKLRFGVDEETIDLFISDANGIVDYNSGGNLPEEEEDAIYSLYKQAEITYFK